jgi:GLPGLI family protein
MKWALFLLIFFCNDIIAQKTYRINYSQSVQSPFTINGVYNNHEISTGLIFNDTLSFYYFKPVNGRDKFKKAELIGDKLDHHAIMYNRNTDEVLYEVAWPNKSYYAIVDTPVYYNWVFNTERKIILGYNCNMGYSIWPTKDTVLVWYTAQLGSVFGPLKYFGLPGIVLEVFDQKYGNHLLATKIEESSTVLVQPNVKKIPAKEYLEQKKN